MKKEKQKLKEEVKGMQGKVRELQEKEMSEDEKIETIRLLENSLITQSQQLQQYTKMKNDSNQICQNFISGQAKNQNLTEVIQSLSMIILSKGNSEDFGESKKKLIKEIFGEKY